MAKRVLLVGKRTQADGTLICLTVQSSTLAEVTLTTQAGVVTRREYVGARAEVLALCTWSQLTGLITQQARTR